VPGEPWNRKITAPDDLEWARRWIAGHDLAGRTTT
jgi:2-C-methyl-D-erythritol 4-phosphate cytidylyltransferase